MRRKIASVLVVTGIVSALVVGTGGTALAAIKGKICDNVVHHRQSGVIEAVQVCVADNMHDILGYDEGWATVKQAPGYPLVNEAEVDVYVDYLKLLADGNVKVQTNPDRWYNGALPFTHTTDWWTGIQADECWAKFSFKIRFAGGDVSADYIFSSDHVVC